MTADSGGTPGDGPKKISEAWIFVSHSHKDLNAVHRVRDEFERLHANPLLFFLMCLKENEEVSSLIKREITAQKFLSAVRQPRRPGFALCAVGGQGRSAEKLVLHACSKLNLRMGPVRPCGLE